MDIFTASIVASRGIAIGRAFVVTRPAAVEYQQSSVEGEIAKIRHAIEKSGSQLALLSKENSIFAAHLEILRDDMLREDIEHRIFDGESARNAIHSSCENMVAMFETIDDEYLRERATDVRDVYSRIESNLTGQTVSFDGICDGDIIIADTLTPSDVARIDISRVGGIVLRCGGTTSHVCIMARSRNIPIIVGISCGEITSGTTIIMDAEKATIIVAPDENETARYRTLMQAEYAKYSTAIDTPLMTHSGEKVSIMANAGCIEDVAKAIDFGANGIGLFRSEFIFMDTPDFPSEEDQYKKYAEAARLCDTRPLTIRTLDCGGDKPLPYLNIEKEENPALGWRGIRVSLSMADRFCEQLRAILRASIDGNVRIMFPMITSVDELRSAKALLEQCKADLRTAGIAFDEAIKVGVMIETPAAVLIADTLAKECDFFSIGTNDLTQYIMAADRTNAKVATICQTASDAVMRAVKITIAAARNAGIECCMCGEAAADTTLTKQFLDAGLRNFSVGAANINYIKHHIHSILNR